MTRARSATRRSLVLLCSAALGATSLAAVTAPTAAAASPKAAPGHDRVVSAVPKTETPNVQDESVDAIYDAGDTIIAGGSFSRVRDRGANADQERHYVFAFDEDTGAVDPGFAPNPNGVVNAVIGGPKAGTVYIAGRFSTVDDAERPKIALLNVADGSVISTFEPPAFNGAVNDLRLVGNRLLVAGNFTKVGESTARGGLASLNASTGEVDDYLTVSVTENHSWTSGSTGARAPVGVDKMAVSPDGSQLVAIGNFKKANGRVHDQVVKIDLDDTSAAIADWNTARYQPLCTPTKFDSYIRDVAFSPNGSYFVIVTTGAAVPDTLCDTAARWEASATGADREPSWVARSGGDTLLSVAASEKAVYVGGHIRWMNNDLGKDAAKAGAIGRASIAALDPTSGLPMSWNPGRHPRGYGITEMYLTSQGLWIGSDQEWIGAKDYKHDRIAFFPLTGGKQPHTTSTHPLPGKVYSFGKNTPNPALVRINAGGPAVVAADGGPNWQADTAAAPIRYHNTGLGAYTASGWVTGIKSPVTTLVPKEIFNSGRLATSAAPNQNWDIPVAKGTSISVKLYFAARCTCAAGSRVFNIDIDGVRKLANVDITAQAGNEIGFARVFNVVSDGNVDIDLGRVTGNMSLSAIEIARNPAPAAAGDEHKTFKRSYDGNTTVGAATEVPNPDKFLWQQARGGFMVGDTLFFAQGSHFHRRTFDGTAFGPTQPVNPYSDAKWDKVITSSGPEGQTYAGAEVDFYQELPSVTGMFYDAGRLYYTLAGHATLYWRGFSPDSGAIGAVRTAVPSTVSFADSAGVFVSSGKLYLASRSTGTLSRMSWVSRAPSGSATVVSGPAVDRVDWRAAKVLFVGP